MNCVNVILMKRLRLGRSPEVWTATGLYATKEQLKIYHYIVSHTLAVLLSTRRRPPKSGNATQLLIVTQPATDGQNPPRGTVNEANTIRNIQPADFISLIWMTEMLQFLLY